MRVRGLLKKALSFAGHDGIVRLEFVEAMKEWQKMMITGELKNKIDGLWDIFAAGGLVNPLEVIEQITYLMFIHDFG